MVESGAVRGAAGIARIGIRTGRLAAIGHEHSTVHPVRHLRKRNVHVDHLLPGGGRQQYRTFYRFGVHRLAAIHYRIELADSDAA